MNDEQIQAGHSPRIADADDYRLCRPFTHEELIANKRHLRMLSGCYYLAAIALIIMELVALLYLVAFIAMLFGWEKVRPGKEVVFSIALGATLLANLLLWPAIGCTILAGRSLIRRQRYTFCLVTAAVVCVLPPLGTILGLCTILVLMRDSVRELFIHGESAFQPDSQYD